MSATAWLPFDVLPEDAEHPIRPDLPWFRHLTFAEGHAVEIGIGLGVLLYVAASLGELAAVFPIALFVVRFAIGMKRRDRPPKRTAKNRRESASNTMCDHTLGLHDIASDPWYFVVATIATVAVLMGVFGIPAAPSLVTVGGLV